MSRSFAILLGMLAAAPLHAQALKILHQDLHVSDGETYFHVAFEAPKGMVRGDRLWQPLKTQSFDWARLPQLVPVDGAAAAVYPLLRYDAIKSQWLPPSALEFVGILRERRGKTFFQLHYPVWPAGVSPDDPVRAFFEVQQAWKIVDVDVTFFGSRKKDDDLKRWWAYAKAGHFAVLERQTPEFGFFGFARAATGRMYGFTTVPIRGEEGVSQDFDFKKLYEVSTGAESITEALALKRMRDVSGIRNEPRDFPVAKVASVQVADHPWAAMIGDKKPAPEPLARLIPHDNYYVRFGSFAKFLEAGDLLDDLGTPFRQGWETHAREYRLKQKLEQQVCLKTGPLSRLFGPAIVKELAITGSDPYFREGTDVTIVFHVTNAKLFLQNADAQLDEARKKFGPRLQSSQRTYQNVAIESHVTPRREVSLHRAVVGDFVIVSNSPRGLERVLDTQQGRLKNLGDALDFKYMRTVFRADDKSEDVFAFLPDDFIRNLTGPATRIKERRRLEALTSLYMATNAALFTAWDDGKLPKDHADLLQRANLKQTDLYVPDSKDIAWHAGESLAVSDVYGTLHFATPLIELPIDRVTETERREYDHFRAEYERLYRQFVDPVGIRVSLEKKRIRAEVYVLPLVGNQHAQTIRLLFGNGTMSFDAARVAPTAALHVGVHLSPLVRGYLGDRWMGDHAWLEWEDSALQKRWSHRKVRIDLGIEPYDDFADDAQRTPLVAGIRFGKREAFVEDYPKVRHFDILGERIKEAKHRGITLDTFRMRIMSLNLFVATLPDYLLISSREEALKSRIDAQLDRKKDKDPGEVVDANLALHLRPQLPHTRDALERLLEWEAHRRALPNANMYQPLRRAGLLPVLTPPQKMRDTAFHWFGFEPVSPDGTDFEYDLAARAYRSIRHGSFRTPTLHERIDTKSPLGRLLDSFESIGITARFREDGLHAIVTLEKKVK